MRNHGRPLLIPLALLTVALPAAPPDATAEPVAQSCADCCKMVCIEAEILKAKYLREFYRQSAKRNDLTLEAYKAGEKIAGAAGEQLRVAAANRQTTCNYYLPDPKDYAESREMQQAGFKPVPDSQGRLALYDYTLTTNTKDCDINAKSVELITKVAPCSDIGEAMKTHEQRHIDDCLPRPPKERTRTPTQTAGDEVRGYDAELAALEQARLVAAEACTKKSCEETKEAWDKSAEMLGSDIRKLLEDGAKKKPSASPLARKRGGK
jgi:hypothetical protein